MKKVYLVAVLLAIGFVGSAQNWQKTDFGVRTEVNSVEVEIRFFNPTTVHVQKWPKWTTFIKESLSLINTLQPTKFNIAQKGNELMLKNESVFGILNFDTGRIAFQTLAGNPLLTKKSNGALFTDFTDVDVKTYSLGQSFVLDKDETIYGLGIRQKGKMVQRNLTVNMVQNYNTEDFETFFQSVKGLDFSGTTTHPPHSPTIRRKPFSDQKCAIVSIIISCMVAMPMV